MALQNKKLAKTVVSCYSSRLATHDYTLYHSFCSHLLSIPPTSRQKTYRNPYKGGGSLKRRFLSIEHKNG